MCFILQIKLVLQPLPSATLTQGTVCVLYTYYIRLSLLLLYYSIYMCVCICVCVCVCTFSRNSVLWVHTLFSLLYLVITGLFMIRFSLKLGKFQQDMVQHISHETSV